MSLQASTQWPYEQLLVVCYSSKTKVLICMLAFLFLHFHEVEEGLWDAGEDDREIEWRVTETLCSEPWELLWLELNGSNGLNGGLLWWSYAQTRSTGKEKRKRG